MALGNWAFATTFVDRHRWLFIGSCYRVVPASEAGRLTSLLAHRLRRQMFAFGDKADSTNSHCHDRPGLTLCYNKIW